MKLEQHMKEKNLYITRMIFSTPKKPEGNKREPRWEQKTDVKIGPSGHVTMDFFTMFNPGQIYFSDIKSFKEFVKGLDETLELLESNIDVKTIN